MDKLKVFKGQKPEKFKDRLDIHATEFRFKDLPAPRRAKLDKLLKLLKHEVEEKEI